MGEPERARVCEQAVKRIISAVLARKTDNHTFRGPRPQHSIRLKLLCDACLYFRDTVGDNRTLQWYRQRLSSRDIAYFGKLTSVYGETSSLGSRNALPACLLGCEEYRKEQ